jgi:hypothetical protein
MLIASFDIGIVNLACCIIDDTEQIKYWEIFDISASTNALKCKRMVKLFDEVEIFKNLTTVLLEFQPNFNPKMRVIQGYVSTYFLIRSVDNDSNLQVIDYSPKHKLNCYDGECPDYTHLKSEYSQRKKLGIFHTQQMIVNQPQEMIDKFNISKKKDDYSDSFLQAISYLRYNNQKIFELGKVTLRKPSPKQLKFKKYTRSNLKYLVIEDLQKCMTLDNGVNLETFLQEWIEKRDGVKKNIVFIYEHDYTIQTIITDLIPEIYLDKGYIYIEPKPKRIKKELK